MQWIIFSPPPIPEPISFSQHARSALEAARGETPGSSAGGEQPKFTAYAMTPDGDRHVIVKFSELEDGSVSERWRDLLLAENLLLETLREGGIPAAKTQIIDHGGQRAFLRSSVLIVSAAFGGVRCILCPRLVLSLRV
ncbi:MAG: hypothetical protein ABL933_14050 [Methyloglobulus sp.]